MQYLTTQSGAPTSFPSDCQIKKMTIANTIAIQCEWIKIITLFFDQISKKYMFWCTVEFQYLVYVCHEMKKVEDHCTNMWQSSILGHKAGVFIFSLTSSPTFWIPPPNPQIPKPGAPLSQHSFARGMQDHLAPEFRACSPARRTGSCGIS